MSIEIVLVDSSQHTEKTLFYFLRQYTPVIHHFQNQDQISNLDIKTPPDVVFIDAEQMQSSPSWEKFQNQNSQTPVILLYKQNASIENKDSTTYQGKLQKPLNAKAVQDIIQKFVPKTQDLKLNSFLKFYPKEESTIPEPKISLEKEKSSPDSSLFSQPISIDGMIEDGDTSQNQDQKNIPLAPLDKPPSSHNPPSSLAMKEDPVQKEPKQKLFIKENPLPQEDSTQKKDSQSPDQTQPPISSKTSTIFIPPEKKTSSSSEKNPPSHSSGKSLQTDIRDMIQTQFQKEWQTTIQKQITKDMEAFIKSESSEIFKKHLDKILKDQISHIIKDKIKDILSKVLPNVVEYYLKKELNKEQKK